jgi:uncharacterized protein YecE (DUF72 family)
VALSVPVAGSRGAGGGAMVYLGTSGYSFRDWVGPFYTPGIRPGEMLSRYARTFSAVEINTTYYRVPPARVFARMVERTPPGFRFTVKLPALATHERARDRTAIEAFLAAVAPLEEAGKLHGLLAQFPFSFRPGPESYAHLRFLRDTLAERPFFAEFRHESWARSATFTLLESLSAGFCAVDEPRLPGLFPPVVRPTGPVGYVRLHGRNAETWWSGDGSTRYHYLYNDRELSEWADAIRQLEVHSRDTFVFFNNCHAGHAAQNALKMAELLEIPLGA